MVYFFTMISNILAFKTIHIPAMPILTLIYFWTRSEVFKALNKTRGLYLRWQEITKTPAAAPNSPEVEWTCTELRNALRSIEWDLEDLEDTINILFNDNILYILCTHFHYISLASHLSRKTSAVGHMIPQMWATMTVVGPSCLS